MVTRCFQGILSSLAAKSKRPKQSLILQQAARARTRSELCSEDRRRQDQAGREGQQRYPCRLVDQRSQIRDALRACRRGTCVGYLQCLFEERVSHCIQLGRNGLCGLWRIHREAQHYLSNAGGGSRSQTAVNGQLSARRSCDRTYASAVYSVGSEDLDPRRGRRKIARAVLIELSRFRSRRQRCGC